jgi:hypothetical protein
VFEERHMLGSSELVVDLGYLEIGLFAVRVFTLVDSSVEDSCEEMIAGGSNAPDTS